MLYIAMVEALHEKYDPTRQEDFQTKLCEAGKHGQTMGALLKKELDELVAQKRIVLLRHSEFGNKKQDDGVYHWARVPCFIINAQQIQDEFIEIQRKLPADKAEDEQYIYSLIKTKPEYLSCWVNKIKCSICHYYRDYNIGNFKNHLTSMLLPIYTVYFFLFT